MLSKLFQDSVNAQLADALADEQRFLREYLNDLELDSGVADIRSVNQMVRSLNARGEIIKQLCARALTYSKDVTPEEALEFAQRRLMKEYADMKAAVEATLRKVPLEQRWPADYGHELADSMENLAVAFVPSGVPVELDEPLKLFISHSSLDAELALHLVKLLRAALPLRSEHIRCTSVDGYRLPAGADTDERLRDEVLRARMLIGVISSSSLESAYVLFELGARWGARKNLVPLLGPGMKAADLKGPVAGLNALSCENQSQLHQLVSDAAGYLGLIPDKPQAYQQQIDAMIHFAKFHRPSRG